MFGILLIAGSVLTAGMGLAAMPSAASLAAAAPGAQTAECELTVDGRTYIEGICQFTPRGGGSFGISKGGRFAHVDLSGPGVAEARWNARAGATRVEDLIGTVRRQGACWVNRRARICARALPAGQGGATAARISSGAILYPDFPGASQSCVGAQGALTPGSALLLRNCRTPDDKRFAVDARGALGLVGSSDLCLDLESPGMSRPPELVVERCTAGARTWTTAANATRSAVVRSSDGLCLVIPGLAQPDARFPFVINAIPCAQAGARAVKFFLER